MIRCIRKFQILAKEASFSDIDGLNYFMVDQKIIPGNLSPDPHKQAILLSEEFHGPIKAILQCC